MSKEDKNEISILSPEVDKAAADVIRTAAGSTTEGIVNFSSDVLGALLGDRVKEWRTRNMVEGAAKTAEFLKAKGIPLEKAKALPMGELYEMFDGLSKVDEPNVRELYAKLLANALDPNSSVSADKAFSSVLSQFTPRDVAVMEFISYFNREDLRLKTWSNSQHKPDFSMADNDPKIIEENYKVFSEKIQKERKTTLEKIDKKYADLGLQDTAGNELAIQNLIRLSCITVNIRSLSTLHPMHLTDRTDFEAFGGGRIKLLNPDKTVRAIQEIYDLFNMSTNEKKPSKKFGKIINKDTSGGIIPYYAFTSFGECLMNACSIDFNKDDS